MNVNMSTLSTSNQVGGLFLFHGSIFGVIFFTTVFILTKIKMVDHHRCQPRRPAYAIYHQDPAQSHRAGSH